MAARDQKHRELHKTAKDRTLAMGRNSVHIDGLKQDLKSTEKYLAQTNERLEALRVESKGQGRIVVISDGERPKTRTDPRLTSLVSIGAWVGFVIAGGSTALGLVLR